MSLLTLKTNLFKHYSWECCYHQIHELVNSTNIIDLIPTSVNFIPGLTTFATAAAVGDIAASSSSESMAPRKD